MLAAAQRPRNSSEYEFVEIDVIILSVGSAATLPPEPPSWLFLQFMGEVNEFFSPNL